MASVSGDHSRLSVHHVWDTEMSKNVRQSSRGDKMFSPNNRSIWLKQKAELRSHKTISACLPLLLSLASSHKLFHETRAALIIWVKSFHNQVFCAGINIVPAFVYCVCVCVCPSSLHVCLTPPPPMGAAPVDNLSLLYSLEMEAIMVMLGGLLLDREDLKLDPCEPPRLLW